MDNFNKKDKTTVEISMATFFKVIAIVAVGAFLFIIKDIVAIVFFSILLVLLLQPPVSWLSAKRIPKSLSVIIIYVLLISLFALSFILIIPPIQQQSGQMLMVLEQYTNNISAYLGVRESHFSGFNFEFTDLNNYFTKITASVFSQLGNVIGAFITLGIVLVISFYGLVEESAFKRIIRSIVPSVYQPYLYQIATRIQRKLGMWLRGQLLLAFVIFLFTYIGLLLLGVEYALVLALLAGVLEFIPYVGPLLSGVVAAFLNFFVSPLKALMVIILFLFIQQIENHVLVPKIMQKATGLNPVVSIVALLVGAKLGGIVGILLAIPVTLALSVFVQDFVDKQAQDQYKIEE